MAVQTVNYGQLRVPTERLNIRDAAEAYMVYPHAATVTVEPGLYRGLRNTNIRLHGRNVRIVAAEDATSTIVSCQWMPSEVRPTGTVRRVIEAFLDSSLDGGPNGAVLQSGLEGFRMRDCGSIGSAGGAVSVSTGAGLTVKRSVLENNTAEDGGAIYVSAAMLALETSLLVNNTARSNGGAVFVGAGAVVTLTTVMVRHNKAGAFGGGIYSDQTTLTMQNLLVTANKGSNAGGLYDSGSTLSAYRTILSHNEGNPTGVFCDPAGGAVSSWTSQSDPDCVCDTGDQLSCSTLQKSEFYNSGTRYSVSHVDGTTGYTVYPTEVSVGLSRFLAAAAAPGRPREFSWGTHNQEWEFCPDTRSSANTPKIHRLTISSLDTRQYIEKIEVYDGKHAGHPLAGSFTHSGDYQVYSTGLGDTTQLQSGSQEMTNAVSGWRGGCLYVRLTIDDGSDSPFVPMAGGFDMTFEPVPWCYTGELLSCGGASQGTCLPQRICQCSSGHASEGSHCSTQRFNVSFLNKEWWSPEPSRQITRASMMARSIKAAVDEAMDGDVLELGTRLFTGLENRAVVLGDKTITLRGSGPLKTIIDCQGSAQGFSIDSRAAPLPNVTITFESLTIKNCVAQKGGGILAIGSRVVLRNVNIQSCSATSAGEEDGEEAGGGGGAYFHSSVVELVDVTFSDNRVQRPRRRSWGEIPLGRSPGGPAMRLTGRTEVAMVNTFVFDSLVCESDGPSCIDSATDRCDSVTLDNTREACEDVEGGGCTYQPWVGVLEQCTAPDSVPPTSALYSVCESVQTNGVASQCRFEGQSCEYQPLVTTIAEACTASHGTPCESIDLSLPEFSTESLRRAACASRSGSTWSCSYVPECVAAADEITCDGSSSTGDQLCNCCNGCHKPLPRVQPDTATVISSETIAGVLMSERMDTPPPEHQQTVGVVLQGQGLAYGPNSTGVRVTLDQREVVASRSSKEAHLVGTTSGMLVMSASPEFNKLSPPTSLWLQLDDGQAVTMPIFQQAGVNATVQHPAVTTDNGGEALLSLHLLSRPAAGTGSVAVRVSVQPMFIPAQQLATATSGTDPTNGTAVPAVCPVSSSMATVDAAGLHTGVPKCNELVPDFCGCWFQPAVAKPRCVHFDQDNWQVVQEIALIGQNDLRSRTGQPYLNWTLTVEAPVSEDVVYSAAVGNVPAQHLSLLHLAFDCPREGEVPNSNGTACLCDSGWEMRTDSTVCSRCLNGFYKTTQGNFECSPCSEDPDQMKLKDTAGNIGSTSRSECLCKPGSFSQIANGSTFCVPCHNGAVCTVYDTTLDQVVTAPGFWRAALDDTQFYQCPVPSQCVGSANGGLNLCSEGAVGPLCAACAAGYARGRHSSECTICTTGVTYPWLAVTILLYLALCAALAFVSSTVYQAEASNTPALLKTLVSFLVSSRAIYSLRDPTAWETDGLSAAVAALFSVQAGLSSFFFADSESFNCMLSLLPAEGPRRAELTAMTYALLPPALFLISSLLAIVRWRIVKPSTLPHPGSANFDEIMNIVPKLQDQLVATFVALSWFMWPALLEVGLQPLIPHSCLSLHHEQADPAIMRMRHELPIVCNDDDGSYTLIAWVSWFTAVLWGGGFPSVFAWMLFRGHRRKATSMSEAASTRGWVVADSGGLAARTTKRRFAFLYFGYASRLWWWESIVSIRKLCVVLVVLLTVEKQAAYRMAVLVGVLQIFMCLHVFFRPMVNDVVAFAETAQLLVSSFTACAMLLLISLDSAAAAATAEHRAELDRAPGQALTVHLGLSPFGVYESGKGSPAGGIDGRLLYSAVIVVNVSYLLCLLGAILADIYREQD
eukprot:COSAG02_NODE_3776_length_6248_cov_9.635876_3_plen_1815_part_01